MTTNGRGIVCGFSCKRLGNFNRRKLCDLRDVSAEENIFCFRFRAGITPVMTCLHHHSSMAYGEPAVAMQVWVGVGMWRAVDWRLNFKKLFNVSIGVSFLKVFRVLPWQKRGP